MTSLLHLCNVKKTGIHVKSTNNLNNTWISGLYTPIFMVIVGDYMYITNTYSTDASLNQMTISQVSLLDPETDRNDNWIGGLSYPTGIAVDGDFMYVSCIVDPTLEYTGTIVKIQMSTQTIIEDPWITGLDGTSDLAIANGYIYLTSYGNGKIGQIRLSDKARNDDWVTGLFCPISLIAIDEYLYVTCNKLSPTTVTRINLSDPMGDINDRWTIFSNTDSIFGLAFYGDYMYISNQNGPLIQVRISDKKVIYRYTGLNLSLPTGLLTFGDYLYVASSGNGNISKIDLRKLKPPTDICFPGSTPICVDQGTIRIDELQPGTHTVRDQPIVSITQTVTQDDHLICFKPHSLGPQIPCQPTLMSRKHQVSYKGRMREAHSFVNRVKGVSTVPYTGEILYNVLMETHNHILVNNMVCETLHPQNAFVQLYLEAKEKDAKDANKEKKKNNKRAMHLTTL